MNILNNSNLKLVGINVIPTENNPEKRRGTFDLDPSQELSCQLDMDTIVALSQRFEKTQIEIQITEEELNSLVGTEDYLFIQRYDIITIQTNQP